MGLELEVKEGREERRCFDGVEDEDEDDGVNWVDRVKSWSGGCVGIGGGGGGGGALGEGDAVRTVVVVVILEEMVLVIGHGGVWSCVVFCFGSMKFGSLGVKTQERDLN